MKVTVKDKYLNVRVGAPSVNAPCNQFIAPGSEIEVDGKFYKGDLLSGTDSWMKDSAGNYYWSGGLNNDEALVSGTIPLWMQQLQIPAIWSSYNEKGDLANIAVLDSGYNTAIPDLANAVKDSNVFFQSVAGNPVTIVDTFGHGSHCASLIGGRNIAVITGCAPESGLYIAKICSQGSVHDYSVIVDAIQWAIDKQVDIISISYGGETPDDSLEAIIKSAVTEHNIVVIASIGDTALNSSNAACYPALYSDCIAVGATDNQQNIAPITILNNKTEINAPGVDIPGYALTAQPENKTGTSQAAAIVAGVCALVISSHKHAGTTYSVKSIRDLLINYSDNIGTSGQKLISPYKIFSNL